MARRERVEDDEEHDAGALFCHPRGAGVLSAARGERGGQRHEQAAGAGAGDHAHAQESRGNIAVTECAALRTFVRTHGP